MEVAPETNILAEEDEYYDEVEVVYLGEARGRGVMTKRSFQRGEVLFTEESYCFVASVHCTPLNIYLLILIIADISAGRLCGQCVCGLRSGDKHCE